MILSKWLKRTGRSVDGFADEIGVRRQTVHRYLNGSRFPRPETIRDIERATEGKVKASDWYVQQPEAAE